MVNTDERTTVKVYVRKGADNQERWLSFRVPDRIPPKAILDGGFAIDGNQAMFAVSQTVRPASTPGMPGYPVMVFPEWLLEYGQQAATDPQRPASLPQALMMIQRGLVGWFDKHGYDVEFA